MRERAAMHRTGLALALVALLLISGCEPVDSDGPVTTDTFEGFTVHSSIPPNPVGIVYLFHGTGGSADFALKIETLDQANALLARGYGWIATESTERTGNKQWFVLDSSIATNPDLARLARLHEELIERTGVTSATPIFGIGMSNGARMVTLFGESFAEAGYPVVAVAPFNGRAAPSVRAAGGLTVPGYWVTAVNDSVVAQAAVEADRQASATLGVATRLAIKTEEPLLPLRFTRIPAVDSNEAVAIHEAVHATGAFDAAGNRILDMDTTVALTAQVSLPATGATPAQVRNQLAAMLALHQFVGLFRAGVADFFDQQRALHD